MRAILITCAVFSASLMGQLPANAQGKGNGLNRGLSAASKGMTNSGMTRSGGPLSRASGGPLRNGAPLGRASGGLQRANAGISPKIEMPTEGTGQDQALANQQSILNHRLDQADHLRAVSQANGNEHLLETADRMQANANRNFLRQQERLGGTTTTSTGGTGTDSTSTAAPTPTESADAAASAATSSTGRRGLWFRSR